MRTAAVAAVAGLLVVLVVVLRSGPRGQHAKPVLRAAPALPLPSGAAKADHFFAQLSTGASVSLAGQSYGLSPVATRALAGLGAEAVTELLSESRWDAYRRSPNLLLILFRLLPELPAAGEHPDTCPFTLRWIEPDALPTRAPGADWSVLLRGRAMELFVRMPDERAVPFCHEELLRVRPEEDLRREAVYVLLRTGSVTQLLEQYATLPPNEGEPDSYVRFYLLEQLHRLAGPAEPESDRALVARFEDVLRGVLESVHPRERIGAAATLLRLGDASMGDRLVAEYGRARTEGDVTAAWSALQLLTEDRAVDGAYRICWACTQQLPATETEAIDYTAALRLLALGWSHLAPVRERIRDYLSLGPEIDLVPLPHLIVADRPATLAFLRAEILGDAPGRRDSAVRFASNYGVPEAGPWLIEILQRTKDERGRAFLLAALVTLRSPTAEALLLADLEGTPGPVLRAAVVGSLLDLAGEEGLARLTDLLARGDVAVLDAVLTRALARGRDAVPSVLVPSLLRVAAEAPGEGTRRKAVLALRARGVLEDVREPLTETYRREPSVAVARDLEQTLVDLAHR